MDLRSEKPALNLYNRQWPLRSTSFPDPPAKFTFDEADRRGQAIDSVVSGGCILSGGVARNSILGRGVRIHSGALVEGCVVMDNCDIGRRAKVQHEIGRDNGHGATQSGSHSRIGVFYDEGAPRSAQYVRAEPAEGQQTGQSHLEPQGQIQAVQRPRRPGLEPVGIRIEGVKRQGLALAAACDRVLGDGFESPRVSERRKNRSGNMESITAVLPNIQSFFGFEQLHRKTPLGQTAWHFHNWGRRTSQLGATDATLYRDFKPPYGHQVNTTPLSLWCQNLSRTGLLGRLEWLHL